MDAYDQAGQAPSSNRARAKLRTSCDNCQAAKVKCGHEKPSCRRCSVQKLECVYSLSRRMGRPRAKKIISQDVACTQPNIRSGDKITSKPATPAAGFAEPIQIPDPWTPIVDDFEPQNATTAADDSSMQPMTNSLDFLPRHDSIELDAISGFTMPSLLEDSSTSTDSQGPSLSALSADFDSQDFLSTRLPVTNDGDLFGSIDPQLSFQEWHSNDDAAQCLVQHPDPFSRAKSASGSSNAAPLDQAFDIAFEFLSDVGGTSQNTKSGTPVNTSQHGSTSACINTVTTPKRSAGHISSEGDSWSPFGSISLTGQSQANCTCLSSILQRIGSLKSGLQKTSSIPIDGVLIMESDIEQSLFRLHKCKSCGHDSTVHLLASINVRMVLDLLQKTAHDEFVRRSNEPEDSGILSIGNFKVTPKGRLHFLRKVLQARFYKLAVLVEKQNKLVDSISQDSFARHASLLLGDISCGLRTIMGWVELFLPDPSPSQFSYISAPHPVSSSPVPHDLAHAASWYNMLSPITEGGIWVSGAFLAQPFANGALMVALLIFMILGVDFLNNQRKKWLLGGIPIVGDVPHLWRRLNTKPIDHRTLFQFGYDTFSKISKPYAVWQQNDDFIIVLPPGTEEETKNVGPDKLSFLHAVDDSYHFWLHTKILGRSHIDAVRQLANKHMNQEAFPAFLAIWHVTHVVAASFLIGPQFTKNSKYIEAIKNYCLQVPGFADMYFWLPAPVRRIYWYLSPQAAKIRENLKMLKGEVGPEVRRIVDAWRNRKQTGKEPTLLQAILDIKAETRQIRQDAKSVDKAEDERQMDIFEDEFIFTGFDSAGPVVCLVVQLLFESIRHKHIIEPLRKEMSAALAASGGEWTDQVMSSLPRLDSFTREVLRVDGPTLFSVTRSVRQPMQLKSAGGLRLRAGSMITSPSWMIHNDERYYEKASEFNPWRFYDEKTNTATTRSTTASNKFLVYGYGVGICPGRHIGIRWSQIQFAKLLMRYDAEFEDVLKGKPDNVVLPGRLLPPSEARIVFRNRE
ncbi:cytochrome P450 [Hyaloscypha finlandica]|nr:cytochrome P450 [Hyaloscypha finlandica]